MIRNDENELLITISDIAEQIDILINLEDDSINEEILLNKLKFLARQKSMLTKKLFELITFHNRENNEDGSQN